MAVEARQTRQVQRGILVLVCGMVLGGLLTLVAELVLPMSAAREFLTTSVAMSVGPFFVDLVALSITIGPISLAVNTLTGVGIVLSAVAVRSWM